MGYMKFFALYILGISLLELILYSREFMSFEQTLIAFLGSTVLCLAVMIGRLSK